MAPAIDLRLEQFDPCRRDDTPESDFSQQLLRVIADCQAEGAPELFAVSCRREI